MGWLSVLRLVWPYLVVSLLSASLAWSIQGVRLTAAEQRMTAYVLEQRETYLKAVEAADQRRSESDEQSKRAREELERQIQAGDVLRRCVAAGKCGAVVVRVPARCDAGAGVSTAGAADAGGADAIPVESGTAAGEILANECAVTTLQLNRLQADIEAQPGYKKPAE